MTEEQFKKELHMVSQRMLKKRNRKIFGVPFRGWREETRLFKQDLARMQGLEWVSWFIFKPLLVLFAIVLIINGGV
tara:strand:+ start:489 stop:716 length:228 start_codon:yes stop_codon:yes gene_type:complete